MNVKSGVDLEKRGAGRAHRKDEVLIMAEEALRMSHIVKIYPNGVMANKDVTLSVNLGEIHALSGENGAGDRVIIRPS